MSTSKINTNKKGEIIIPFGGTNNVPIKKFTFTRKSNSKNIKFVEIETEGMEDFFIYKEKYEVEFDNGSKMKFQLEGIIDTEIEAETIPTSNLTIRKYNNY